MTHRSLLDGESPFHRLGRASLRLIPRNLALPVLSGVNRGLRWRLGAGVKRCWLGQYETRELALMARCVRPGGVVYDLGAHAGYYSLAAARAVGPGGRVFAFEPDATNLDDLRFHVARNGLKQIEIVPHPVGLKHGDLVGFGAGASSFEGHVVAGGDLRLVSIDGWRAETNAPPPNFVKMDVEGFELEALDGALTVLGRVDAVWTVALHGIDQAIGSLRRLRAAGFRVFDIDHGELVDSVPEIIWTLVAVPPGRDPSTVLGRPV